MGARAVRRSAVSMWNVVIAIADGLMKHVQVWGRGVRRHHHHRPLDPTQHDTVSYTTYGIIQFCMIPYVVVPFTIQNVLAGTRGGTHTI